MLYNDLCLKVLFWPVLSHLASLKGLCPYYPYGYISIIPQPPVIIINSTTALPTLPTPPTAIPTTLPPCPSIPLVCLAGGQRPIPYCPCIDPRQQLSQNSQALQINQFNWGTPTNSPVPNPNDVMTFSHLNNKKRRKRWIKTLKFKDILYYLQNVFTSYIITDRINARS